MGGVKLKGVGSGVSSGCGQEERNEAKGEL